MLRQPPVGFAYVQNNLQATPSTSAPGTGVTLGGVAHTKTSWVSMIDPTSADCYWIALAFHQISAATTNTRTLVDIGIGPTGGGSEQVVLPNLLAGGSPNWTASGGCLIEVPLYIPRNSRISIRAQSARTSFTMSAICWVWGGPTSPPWWVAVGADDIGITTASSSGTTITAGNSGAESAWTSVGSTTSKNYSALLAASQLDSNTAKSALAYHWEFGASSTTLGEFYSNVTTTSETYTGLWPNPLMYQQIPSGTQLQARGECSGTAEALDVALYGLY